MTEADFQRTVIECAQMHRWRVAHFRPARVGTDGKGRWVTPVAADGAGFPDLVLVRHRVLFVELKTDTGKLRPDQETWRDAILDALDRWLLAHGHAQYPDPFDYMVWRPKDWPRIEQVLRGD